MDIDCDGDQSDHGDGRCGNSDDTQSTTAFQYQVQQVRNPGYNTPETVTYSNQQAYSIPAAMFQT